MARTEPCILTNMCMLRQGDRVLVQDRNDPDWPGITFPGGHVEPGEGSISGNPEGRGRFWSSERGSQ